MAGAQIIELDELLGDDKLVRFRKGGKVYRLPPDVPVELYLSIRRAERAGIGREDGDADEIDDAIERLHDALLELLRYGDPKLDKLPPEATITQVSNAIARVYGPPPEEAASPPPPKRTRGSAGSSTTRKRTKSRS